MERRILNISLGAEERSQKFDKEPKSWVGIIARLAEFKRNGRDASPERSIEMDV